MTVRNAFEDLALDSSFQPVTATGTITTQNSVPTGVATANSAVEIDLKGRDTVGIQVTGTYTGVLSIQGTVDGTTWVTLTGATRVLNTVTGAYSATIASAAQGLWSVSADGMSKIRVTGLAAMTGTATVSLRASDGHGLIAIDTPLPAGTAVIGGVTQSGTWNVGTVTPGTAATNLGKAEDAAHTSGDVGVMALAIRNDNAGTARSSANGDYDGVSVDSNGVQFVRQKPVTANATPASVTAATSSTSLLAANANRRGATIFNDSTAILYLALAGSASTTAFTTKVQPDGYYEVPFDYAGAIFGIWAAANGAARVTELV